MGGRTISWDPGVIAKEETFRATLVFERVLKRTRESLPRITNIRLPDRVHAQGVITLLRVMLHDPERRPVVLALLGLHENGPNAPDKTPCRCQGEGVA